jgi:hypothetical protein
MMTSWPANGSTMQGIFISYRQDDAKPWALMLRDELVATFGEKNVFLDKDTLRAGNWRTQIQAALARSKVLLVVIGPRWLNASDDKGERRLDDPQDVHRQEIALALVTEGLTVIPVRVDRAPMPRAEQLGADIRALTDHQAREISDASAHRAVDLKILIADIERATGLVARQSAPAPVRNKTRLFVVALVLSVITLLIAELGWESKLDAQEKSFVVLVVLLATLGGAWLKDKLTRGRN